jgi:hypothetical protein
LQQALIQRDAGRLAMHEPNGGVVTRVVDGQVTVQYDTPDGPLEQVYDWSQFVGGNLPQEGDRIEAHVFAWCRPHSPQGIDRFLTPQEIDDANRASEKGSTGPREI